MESSVHDTTNIASNRVQFDLSMLADVVSHSQNVCESTAVARLPVGFDGVDVAILEWIAAEGRRHRRRCCPSDAAVKNHQPSPVEAIAD
jgi:hypothetical protein